MFDERHPDRNKFEEVRTKSSGIYYVTLALCQSRDDELAKTVQARLLSAHDLVAAEARYHVPCRTRFENPAQYSTPGRPTSTEKMTLFNAACKKMEDDMDLYTVAEFHSMMQELGDDVYSLKMTQIKIKEKYGNSLRFVERNGKSKIILLDRVSGIIGEKWYEERDSNVSQETERIVKTAAKLIKDAIKNHEHESSTYPSVEDILGTENPHVPELLKVFMNELVMAPVKQVTLSQALFAATRTRSLMPLQFGLAIATDNHLSLKWLNTLLSRLGFAVSYDEVIRYKQNVVKHDSVEEVICPDGTAFLQFVADNTDHDICTIDGKNTHHGLGSIAIANGNFTMQQVGRNRIPREKKDK
ncbi:uncharacterized protein LOC143445626 [Clavelina lepadiformis]|uniref:uncharacterized protein LOC143445626 n=1 Tax=Clavelina lepadiformis TaxID=159417 RepID=UPI00404245A5